MSDDVLGLDQPIKLTSRRKVSKIDLEGLMDKQKGLPFVISSYKKPMRVMERNDQKLSTKLQKKDLSSSQRKRLRYDNASANLQAVLQYYQLWCHGLLPKAKFKDCIYLLRAFGGRDAALKKYRRTLIETEINKKKEQMGLTVAEPIPTELNGDIFSDDDLYAEAAVARTLDQDKPVPPDELGEQEFFAHPEVPELEDIPNESYDAEMELLREMD